VTSPVSAAILVGPSLTLVVGAAASLPVAIVNTGRTAWAVPEAVDPRRPDGPREAPGPVRLRARWIPLDAGRPDTEAALVDLPVNIRPGDRVERSLELGAPSAAGAYLLLLDVLVPGIGSLTAQNGEPTVVSVNVTEEPAQRTPSPAGR